MLNIMKIHINYVTYLYKKYLKFMLIIIKVIKAIQPQRKTMLPAFANINTFMSKHNIKTYKYR